MIKLKDVREDFEYPDAKVVEFQEKDLFIKQYLPAKDKYGLIQGVIFLLGVNEGPVYPLLSEVLFYTELVKAYTNINFDDYKEDFFKTYDILNISGLLELVIKNIPVEEYDEICELYEESVEEAKLYSKSMVSLIGTVVGLFKDGTIEKVGQEIENFDIGKHEAVVGILEKLGNEQHI